MSTHPLSSVGVVLVEPQDLVNIAGVVRAMKNMGLSRLTLVRPAEFDAWRICGIAHRAEDVVRSARIVDTLEEALSDAVLVVGTTARARTAQRNYERPRGIAPLVVECAREGPVSLLFGREDRGLSNADLDLCDRVCIIPTVPDYSSLNLAQAVLLLAYEVFLAAEGDAPPLPRGRRSVRPATRAEIEETFRALRSGLESIDFFKARTPESVMRTLRTLVSRARPDVQEARLLAAVGYEIGHYIRRNVRPGGGGDGTSAL